MYEFRRSLTENLHQKFINALRELNSNQFLDEGDQISPQSSSDDGFSEDCGRKCMQRSGNFK